MLLFFSLVSGLGVTLGHVLFTIGEGTSAPLYLHVVSGLATGILFFFLTLLCTAVLARLAGALYVRAPEDAQQNRLSAWKLQLILFVSWLPCYFAYFPAIYSYDAEPQLFQYTGAAFDDHHPLFHTLTLGWAYDFGQWLQARGIALDGMAVYSLVQMFLLSFALSRLVCLLTELGLTKRGRILTMLFFALFPLHPLMAVTTSKDTYFSAFLVLLSVALARLLLFPPEGGQGTVSFRHLLPLTVSALFMMLFRKNGFYMMLGLLLVLAVVVFRPSGRRGNHPSAADSRPSGSGRLRLYRLLLCATALSLALFLLLSEALIAALGAKRGEAAEALNIPLQQIARTYASNRETLQSSGELEEILYYETEEGLRGYRPYISDMVKQGFRNEAFAENPFGFVSLWTKLFLRYPSSYVTAVLYHTMGAWYPLDVSHTLVYRDWWRDRTGYYITNATPVFAERFVKEENLLPALRRVYEWFATDCVQLKFVPLQLLFSPWLYCTGSFFLFLALLVKRRQRAALVTLPHTVNLLFIYLGPCVIARYFYPFIALFPLMVALAVSPYVTEEAPLPSRKAPAPEADVPEVSGACMTTENTK